MIDLSDYIVAGIITKTHGVHGQVILQLNNLSFDDILKLESVFIEIDRLPVPFFIESYSQKNRGSIILSIEDIRTEKRAEELIDKKVYMKSDILHQGSIIIQQTDKLLGYNVIDKQHGKIGVLDEILDFQYNPLLKVINGKKEILIPFQAEFIFKIDERSKTIFVDTPLGLTNLFD
jgi:16S rRNA processing protein RimM